ncbi:conjugal transfer protein TraJ [Novosphingobium sediminis]|uniref:Conjugal transfer protein TraJ n=1 Tax=Novosphingobium sediminis TaxID=707214 RepID=A0A512AN82_9SPHN|nr:type IV secretion system protein [Novosphingobium sediminis]GEO01170.1 conjugal transfer protein TraJ [Novosphingobium sediminis]
MKNEVSSDKAAARKAYYASAESWAADRTEQMARTLRLTRLLAAGAAAVAVIEAIALIAITPLKTVVPYTIMVDRTTGFATVLDEKAVPNIKPDSALTQSLLAQYVVARETFDVAGLQGQYRKVALWSGEQARRDYLGQMQSGNPESPINRYPRGTIVETVIESVTPMADNAALVRFYTQRRDRGQEPGAPSYWVSLVRFRFSGTPMALNDRLINPLGFQVVHYRRDQEAPPPVSAATQASADNTASGAALPLPAPSASAGGSASQ